MLTKQTWACAARMLWLPLYELEGTIRIIIAVLAYRQAERCLSLQLVRFKESPAQDSQLVYGIVLQNTVISCNEGDE